MFNFSKKKKKDDKSEESSSDVKDGVKENLNEGVDEPSKEPPGVPSNFDEDQAEPPKFGEFESTPGAPPSTDFNKASSDDSDKKIDLSGIDDESEGDVSFEVPDFTEEDINLNISLEELRKKSREKDEAEQESAEGLDEDVRAAEATEESVEEAPQEIFDDSPEEVEEDSLVEDLPVFDEVKEEATPSLEVVERKGPLFLSKHKYKGLLVSLLDFKKELSDTLNCNDEFFKAENSLISTNKEIVKNVDVLKNKFIEVDKKIFI